MALVANYVSDASSDADSQEDRDEIPEGRVNSAVAEREASAATGRPGERPQMKDTFGPAFYQFW